MSTVEIRNYETSDLEHCRLLWIELTKYHSRIYRDPSIEGNTSCQYFDKHLTNVGSQNIWLAIKDGMIIGMIGLVVSGKEAEIEPIIVTQKYQNQGIGKVLVIM